MKFEGTLTCLNPARVTKVKGDPRLRSWWYLWHNGMSLTVAIEQARRNIKYDKENGW